MLVVQLFGLLILAAFGSAYEHEHARAERAYRKQFIRNRPTPQSRPSLVPSTARPPVKAVSQRPEAEQADTRIDDRFSLDLFAEISIALNGTDNNVVVSPASIQPLLLLLADGLSKGELRNLLRAMHLSTHPGAVYREFQKYQAFASIKTSSVEVLSNQTVFADPHRPQDIGYIDSLQRNYKVHLESIDFGDPNAAAKTINSYVATQTRGKIATVVQPQFLINARLALTSTIYFNGKWKLPFNGDSTATRAFYGEDGQEIGSMPMMFQTNWFRTTHIDALHANALELPYGDDGRWFMWILLPQKGKTLIDVVTALRNVNVTQIGDRMEQLSTNDRRDVIVPRFRMLSGLNLQPVLLRMGITTSSQSDFDVFHKSVVEVNEEGTTAAAYTEQINGFTSLSEPFIVNRPFAFLIVDRQIGAVLFAGQVRNPLKR